jgi:hypothetical protein
LQNHFLSLKNYRKILFYTGLVLLVLFVSLVASVFLFKDKIIRQFVREANKHLNTPIKVASIEVTILDHFPRLSIVMRDVYVEDSHPGDYPLLTAKEIAFQLNPLEVYRGEYNIKGLSLRESEATLKINAEGKNNYTILKEDGGTQTGSAIKLALKDVGLRATKFSYIDLRSRQHLVFSSEKLTASIETENDIFNIDANGQLTSEKIEVEGKTFLAGKSFQIKSEVVYDDKKKSLAIKPSSLDLPTAGFTVSGTYEWKDKPLIAIRTVGKEADIQTILSLLPETVSQQFEQYKSEGEVYFTALLEGELSRKKNPSLNIEFGFSNAVIFHPEFKTRIEKATLKGIFKTSDVSDPSKARISLRDVTGTLNGEPFAGELMIEDFNNPYVDGVFRGKLDAGSVYGFYPMKQLQEVSGTMMADVSLKGKISLLKNKSTAQQVVTQGTIDLEKIKLLYGEEKIPLKDLSGNLQFSNNDLALSNVAGKLGNSDFILNGFFKNIITFILFENQPVGIETDLKSTFVDLDELFRLAYAEEDSQAQGGAAANTTQYEFDISKNVYLNFNCDVQKLNYKRFSGRKIKGDLLVKNKVAVSRKLSLETMGGNLVLSGIVDSNNPRAIDVVCTSHLNEIDLDSVFYVFENFDQDFIQDKHLKGNVTADVDFEMTLDQNLRLFQETLIADIGAVIKNGELNNFEPMKKLNRYLDDEGLNHLRFSDLKNDIHIEKKTIYIPQMQVNSNVTDIRISGTHSFDQRIDYRLVTPLRGKRNIDTQAVNAVGLDEKGQTKLFLKITGTTDNYKIQYDTESVKKKIITDLKNEVKELKDAFRNKETQKKKEIELEKDDYFEWSE